MQRGDLRSRVARRARGDASSFQHHDDSPVSGELASDQCSGHAAADDQNVDITITV
jgi:hypothetical protein